VFTEDMCFDDCLTGWLEMTPTQGRPKQLVQNLIMYRKYLPVFA